METEGVPLGPEDYENEAQYLSLLQDDLRRAQKSKNPGEIHRLQGQIAIQKQRVAATIAGTNKNQS